MNYPKMTQLCDLLLREQWLPNNFDKKEQENMVIGLLDQLGFNPFLNVDPTNPKKKLFSRKDFEKARKEGRSVVPDGYYCYQPLGGSNFPDMIVCENTRMFVLECKSNEKATRAAFSSTAPSGDTLYVCSLGKFNATFIVWGRHISNDEEYAALIEYKNGLKAVPRPQLRHLTVAPRAMVSAKHSTGIFLKGLRETWAQEILNDLTGLKNYPVPYRPTLKSNGSTLCDFLASLYDKRS